MTSVASTAKKIRKFRIHARPSAVVRHVRALLDNAHLTPELEKAVESECRVESSRLDTSAIYDTVTPSLSPAWLAPWWVPAEGEKKPVALTVFVSTAGGPLETEIAAAFAKGEDLRARLLTALGSELADQSGFFVARLASEEARRDSCELQDVRILSSETEIRSALELLDASRVGISVDSAGVLSPRFSRVGVLPWGPPARKK